MRVAPGATRIAAVAVLLAAAGVFLTPWLSLAGVVLAAFTLYFFRDPERDPPESGVVSPADGKVSVIREEDGRLRVGVYMNALDVHVNRAPLSGEVHAVDHRPGAHRPAFSKDSDRNERVRFDFGEFEVDLVAGWFARRIVPYAEVGDEVERGERIGHIAFGSRADVLLPAGFDRDDLRVEMGERVRAGETVLADEP